MSEQLKRLPVGCISYEEIISSNRYYVDKTSLLKTIFKEDSSKVLLITRPRRFGKTLTLDMFKCFLALNPQNPQDKSKQERLFCDKQIYKDKDFCNEFMGEYPVISVSFKDVGSDTFDDSFFDISLIIRNLYGKYLYLLDSNVLNQADKENFNDIYSSKIVLNDPAYTNNIKNSLKTLAELLYKHHQKQVILLIDEYDVPLSKASSYGYYEKMLPLVRGLLSVLKDGDTFLCKSVVTGCLRVVKESIFTGVNNLKVNTILSKNEKLNNSIGFTQEETQQILEYYHLSDFQEMVKNWYDGYNFYNCEIYSAWDVIKFVSAALNIGDLNNLTPENHWVNTSSNDIIKEFLGHITSEDAQAMQTLIDGGSVVKRINPFVTYEDLKSHTSEDFYSMLLYTGYLTVADFSTYTEADYLASLRIPNESVRQCFKHNIYDYFTSSPSGTDTSVKMVDAIFNKDAEALGDIISEALNTYISVRDFSCNAKKEYYYHAFLNGRFSCMGHKIVNYSSNGESGDGYADIMFTDTVKKIGVVIELKVSTDGTLAAAADRALSQIEEKNYAGVLENKFCVEKVYCYGIAFKGKKCVVRFKELNTSL